MVDLSKLDKNALSAAMRGGTEGWGQIAIASQHIRYAHEVPKSRRKCYCGCNGRATYRGMCNGLAMASGCELSIRRWVKTGRAR